MKDKILILGHHPLCDSLIKQYKRKGCDVVVRESIDTDLDINRYSEVCLLPIESPFLQDNTQTDGVTLSTLHDLAFLYHPAQHNGRKLKCHMLLTNNKTLQIIQIQDFSSKIRNSLDVYPFTMEDEWSKTIVLDRQPITIHSEKNVHLVIFGKSQMTERVAINAAYMAHYPNYIRNHELRTRITIISEQIESWRDGFIQRYQNLFEHSFYRSVSAQHQIDFHHPIYTHREDFVDIEWEFVDATCYSQIVKEKLQFWSCSHEHQLLTIVFAHEENMQNIQEAFILPACVCENKIPVYVYTNSSALFQNISLQEKAVGMIPFGMLDRGYDIELPLVEMAKTVNAIYQHCYIDDVAKGEKNLTTAVRFLKYAVDTTSEERNRLWEDLPFRMRMSCIGNAMNVATKMHSVGIMENEWIHFYELSSEEIEMLAQVEHNRWCVERLIMGWRSCTDEERKKVDEDICQKKELKLKKIHYDLCAFSELGFDETGKHVALYDLCLCASIPYIVKHASEYQHQKGGEDK